jgi:hypothetical protein
LLGQYKEHYVKEGLQKERRDERKGIGKTAEE